MGGAVAHLVEWLLLTLTKDPRFESILELCDYCYKTFIEDFPKI